MTKRTMWTALILLAAAMPAVAQQTDKDKALEQELIRLEAENKQLQLRLERLEGLVNQLQAERADMNNRLTSVGSLLDQVGSMLAGGPVPDDLRHQAMAMRQQPRTVIPAPQTNTTTNNAGSNTSNTRPAPAVSNTNPRTNVNVPRPPAQPLIPPVNPLLRPQDSAGGTGGGIVAAVDIMKVFNSLLEKAEADAALQIAKERFVEDARERGKTIVDMRLDLGNRARGTAAYDKLKSELEDELQRYQIWRSVQMNSINRQHGDRLEQIYQRAVETIGRIATENGYDVVVYKEREGQADLDRYQSLAHMALTRKLLYTAEEEDLTGMVITRMNAEFSSHGANAAGP